MENLKKSFLESEPEEQAGLNEDLGRRPNKIKESKIEDQAEDPNPDLIKTDKKTAINYDEIAAQQSAAISLLQMQSTIVQPEEASFSTGTDSQEALLTPTNGVHDKEPPRLKSKSTGNKAKVEPDVKDEVTLAAPDLPPPPTEPPIKPSEELSIAPDEPTVEQPALSQAEMPQSIESSTDESVDEGLLVEEPEVEDIALVSLPAVEPPILPDFAEVDSSAIDMSPDADYEGAEEVAPIDLEDDFVDLVQAEETPKVEDVLATDAITEMEEGDMAQPNEPTASRLEVEQDTLLVELERHIEELPTDDREEAQLIIDTIDELIESAFIPEVTEVEVVTSENDVLLANTIEIEDQAEQLVIQLFEVLKMDYDERDIKLIVQEMISDYSSSIETSVPQELTMSDKGTREQKPGILSVIYRYVKQKINLHLSLGGFVLRTIAPNPSFN